MTRHGKAFKDFPGLHGVTITCTQARQSKVSCQELLFYLKRSSLVSPLLLNPSTYSHRYRYPISSTFT